ncbi:hypothetical protein ElyMa_002698200 [Elysia marginata]|uniref:Uncharacterized protein n=1 Tax=Elysia marginata TaxID=1093978 RepID=A0AAV4HBU6_9GAST|nr:hypothetical protein ElyMa_002698200 [Elysia marginata]
MDWRVKDLLQDTQRKARQLRQLRQDMPHKTDWPFVLLKDKTRSKVRERWRKKEIDHPCSLEHQISVHSGRLIYWTFWGKCAHIRHQPETLGLVLLITRNMKRHDKKRLGSE